MAQGGSVTWRVADVLRRSPPAYWVARRAFTAVNRLLPPVTIEGVPGPVHRNDLMVDRASPDSRAYYRTAGLETVELVRDALAAAGGDLAEADVLDFGCGHGRIVRHFAAAARSISACDLDHEGVRFCARHLGARPVLGDRDITKVPLEAYDAIWLGSVITHHPEDVCRTLLSELAGHVRPGGVLVVTSTDERSLDHYVATRDWVGDHAEVIRRDLAERGAAYVDYPQNSGGSYGLGFQTSAWLDGVAASRGLEQVWHRPDAWGIQHVTAWRRPAG
jgi:2-polyprenyl-3-methyl-5-hydroxy-6-metoxy-1,4-benzoquinol methylase